MDGVYDSRHEAVAFEVDVEEAGEHVIAIRYTDAAGNRSYRTVVVNVE